jgi:hypothetical protein
MISESVAPLLRWSIATTWAVLLPSRGAVTSPALTAFLALGAFLAAVAFLVAGVSGGATRKLEIPTKKGSITLEQFEQMPNAAKRDHIAKFPIEDLFMPVLDTDSRNGIGHNAAHYEQEHDVIVIFDTKDAGTVSRVIGYTEFCEKVLDLFAAFELAALYHHDLHIYLDGRFV